MNVQTVTSLVSKSVLLWLLLLLLLVGCSHLVLADDDEYRLLRHLLRNYDRRIRPSLNASESLNVTFGLALAQIIDVDEKNQIITTNCWLNQVWIDYKLRWNPKKYGGINVIRIPHTAVWRPDILLYNNADMTSYKSSISTNVIVTSDGNVTWLSMVIFRSSCAIDVKHFPFDEQNCTMLFSSWTYDGFQVNLDKVGDDGDTSNYIPNNEWTLIRLHVNRNVKFYSCCAEPYPDITYVIQIRRKPLFYVFNMILPCLLITLVALLGFYMPSDSGEKVSMGITTLLSMTVFLMLVSESMPPTSDVLPLVGLYYGFTIATVSLATAMTVLTLNIHHNGHTGRPVPRLLRAVCLDWLRYPLCIDINDVRTTSASLYRPDVTSQKHQQTTKVTTKLTTANENNKIPPPSPMTTVRRHLPNGPELTQLSLVDLVSSPEIESQLVSRATSCGENGLNSSVTSPHYTVLHQQSQPLQPVDSSSCVGRVMDAVERTLDRHWRRQVEQDRREQVRVEWQQVALVVDRALLVVFVGVTMAVSAAILLNAPYSVDFLLGIEPTTALVNNNNDNNPTNQSRPE